MSFSSCSQGSRARCRRKGRESHELNESLACQLGEAAWPGRGGLGPHPCSAISQLLAWGRRLVSLVQKTGTVTASQPVFLECVETHSRCCSQRVQSWNII